MRFQKHDAFKRHNKGGELMNPRACLLLLLLQCFASAVLACGMTTHTEIAHRSEVRFHSGSFSFSVTQIAGLV
jgi:hypothetical protein